MIWTLAGLWDTLILTLRDPAAGFARLRQANPPLPARTAALLLLAVLSALAVTASVRLSPALQASPMGQAVMTSPISAAGIQWAVTLLASWLVLTVGRWRGGTGNWGDSVLAVVWLQAVLLAVQVAQIVAALVAPFVADLLGLASVFLFFWLITAFVAEVHGFRSRPLVLVSVILTILAVAILLSVLLTVLFGPGVPDV